MQAASHPIIWAGSAMGYLGLGDGDDEGDCFMSIQTLWQWPGCDICSWLWIQPWFIRQPQEAAKHQLALVVLMVFF